jgi:hypothetical protein
VRAYTREVVGRHKGGGFGAARQRAIDSRRTSRAELEGKVERVRVLEGRQARGHEGAAMAGVQCVAFDDPLAIVRLDGAAAPERGQPPLVELLECT